MRVGIIALLQESNTFLPERTSLEHFERDMLITGDAIRSRFTGGHHEVSGFLLELDDAGVEAVPVFAARALPYGIISCNAWQHLLEGLFEQVDRVGRCDGYLVAAHGATVSETSPDADGYWLNELRSRLGASLPIVGTLDPHANLSPAMVDACDALIAYRTNPHVDQLLCGRRAASLIVRSLRGDVRPVQAASFPPLVINIAKQNTSLPPCRPIFDAAERMLERRQVLSNSVLLGFPYADVPEMGASTLVVTDGDSNMAQNYADELAASLWTHREQFLPKLISAEEAVDRAKSLQGPVCLLDMGDNVGGGSPGDSTWLLHAIAKRHADSALVCIHDATAVAKCVAADAHSTLQLSIGGRSGPMHGVPFVANFTILGLYEGKFVESQPRHGGHSLFDQGRSVVVRTDVGLTILLTSQRMAPFSLAQLTSCRLNPNAFQLIVAKGVVAPMAAYGSVCKHFIHVNTPGVTTADISQLPYANRRRPLYPFESAFTWRPSQTV